MSDSKTTNRGLTTRTAFSNALRTDLWEKLTNESAKTGIPLSRLLDKCVEAYFEKKDRNDGSKV